MSAESQSYDHLPEPERQLRPHQENGLRIVEEARHGGLPGGYLNWATGVGKTEIAAHSIKNYLEENPDGRVLWLCHRNFILEHASESVGKVLGTHRRSHMFGNEFEDQGHVVFANFSAMNRQRGDGRVYEAFDPKEFGYVVVDEGHHGPAPTYRQVIEYFDAPFKLGLTPVPHRRDRQDIGEIFGPELDSISLEEAIAKSLLARPEYHVLTDQVQQLSLKTLEGKSLSAINKLLFVPKRDQEIAATIKQYWLQVDNPRMLVFCPSIPHAEYFASMLPGNAETLHSKQDSKEQDKNWHDFRLGRINTLLAVDMLNEGIDVPDVNMVVFLRATDSQAIYLQQVGRGLRLHPGKDRVLILDFVASWERIHTLMTLEKGIKSYYGRQGKEDKSRLPQFADTEAVFHYSAEALRAAEIIQYARGSKNRPRPAKETPRADRWAEEEIAVKELLGLSNLPKQRLTGEEWQRYGEKIAAGDEVAKSELLMRCLRSAYSMAKQHATKLDSAELPVEEAFQVALIAVHEAIETYQKKGANNKRPLREEITWAIWGDLEEAKRKRGLIRLPGSYYNHAAALEKGHAELIKKLGEATVDSMSLDELSGALDLDIEETRAWQELGRMAYEQMVDGSQADEQASEEPDAFEQAAEVLAKEKLREALENLSYRERRVLELRYGLGGESPKTADEVRPTFQITRERVFQIERAALKKLQSMADAQQMRDLDPVYG